MLYSIADLLAGGDGDGCVELIDPFPRQLPWMDRIRIGHTDLTVVPVRIGIRPLACISIHQPDSGSVHPNERSIGIGWNRIQRASDELAS